jgi:hypothetical protein
VLYKIREGGGIAQSVQDVGYRLEKCQISVQVLSSPMSRPTVGPTQPPVQRAPAAVKLNTNNHYNTSVKNTLRVLVTWGLIKHRDFTFKYLYHIKTLCCRNANSEPSAAGMQIVNPLLQECK